MESKDTKENKSIRIAVAISKMEVGEVITPTKLSKEIANLHPDTLRDSLDLYDSLRQIGFIIVRDENEKIKFIQRTDESLENKKIIRDVKNDLNDIKITLEELISKNKIKKIKKK